VAGSWRRGPGTIAASRRDALRVLYLSLRARDRLNPSDSSTSPLAGIALHGRWEFLILIADRTDEVIGAQWMNLEEKI
jgi:hypothetical protein